MPLFATLMASGLSAMVGFFARFMGLQLAQKIASYTLYIATTVAFLVTVLVCLKSLLGFVQTMFSGSYGLSGALSWVNYFGMAVGMFIPSNAVPVIACVASVWIGTSIYKVQKQGLHNYGS